MWRICEIYTQLQSNGKRRSLYHDAHGHNGLLNVSPAQAGIQEAQGISWIPAFAGITAQEIECLLVAGGR